MKTISAIVAGTGFEGRAERIRAYCQEGAAVSLVREPDNPHDPNAIAVLLHVRWMWGLIKFKSNIGHLKASRAKQLAEGLDRNKLRVTDAWVESFYAPEDTEHPRVSLRINIEEAM